MKPRRSLDHDGLDGILQQIDRPQSKPAWIRSLWTIPVIIALAISVFLLHQQFQTSFSTNTILVQNFSSKASEQISKAEPLLSKQVLTTSPEKSKIQETPALPVTEISAVLTPENIAFIEPESNLAPVKKDQTIADSVMNSKTQVVPTLPPKSSLISGNDVAKPSTDAFFTVYFKFDSSKPSLLSKTGTKKLINFAKSCQNKISLTGHTCNLGTDEANLQKGWIRANALKKLLIANGIPAQRIVTASKGMRKPINSNDTLSGRALNRRAELFCLEP